MSKRLTVLKITHGEYEFMSHYVHPCNEDPQDVAKNFYGDGAGEEGDNGYYFNLGEVHVKVYKTILLTNEEEEVLERLL